MKYNLHVNQKRALGLGIKNINQAHVFDLLSCSQLWAKPEIINGEVYYWVARQRICDELEILSLKPDTVYRHLKSLNELKLIEYQKKGKKDLIQITELGKSYYVGNKSELDKNSEIDPSKFGNRSENDSEIDPTYNTTNTNHTTIDNNTVGEHPVELAEIVETESKIPSESEKGFDFLWKEYSEACKKQNRRPGKKSISKDRYFKLSSKTGLKDLKTATLIYIDDCLVRNTYLQNFENFLNKNSIEEWKNGSENHQALLELKKTPHNHQKNSVKYESKTERMERDVAEYRESITGVLDSLPDELFAAEEDQKLIN